MLPPASVPHRAHPSASDPGPADFAHVFSERKAACHEVHAAREADYPAGLGLLLALAHRLSAKKPLLWARQEYGVREAGNPYPPGLAEFGIDAARILFIRAGDAQSVLQAGLEGARCPALGAVLIDLWGETRAYDLTASRRLALAAYESGTPVLLLRSGAREQPSAAQTRWRLRAAPSRALAANAPGIPAFDLTLLRARDGRENLRYRVEWDRDARNLLAHPLAPTIDLPGDLPTDEPPSLSRPVVPFSLDRPGAARDAPPRWRQAG